MAEGDPRRRLLARTDSLLERIEQLRLQGSLRVPEQLLAQIASTAADVGTPDVNSTPATLAAAHRYLFRLQESLLSRVPQSGRPSAMRAETSIPLLELPPRHRVVTEAEWREQIRLVLQRAQDCTRYLAGQERAAARDPARAEIGALRHDQAEQAKQVFESLVGQADRALGHPVELDPPPAMPTTGRLHIENVVIDLDPKEVHQEGRLVALTPIERACLVALAANPGRTLTREAMLHLVYGDDPQIDVRSRVLDVHLSHVRQKLGRPDWLTSVAGIGFRALTQEPISEVQPASIESIRIRRRDQRRAWARNSPGLQPPPRPVTPAPTLQQRPDP